MKRILFFSGVSVLLLLIAVACKNGSNQTNGKPLSTDLVKNPNSANGSNDTSNLPVFKFEEEIHDFGRIIQGEKVSYGFKFKNIGKSDLVISDVHTSCGCTVADYPKTPIAANGQGVIDITFNSEGKRGYVNKVITIMANTQPNTKVLNIKAQIKLPEGGNDN